MTAAELPWQELQRLHETFRLEQADAAEAEAADRFKRAAGARGVVYRDGTSAWVEQTLRTAKGLPCRHTPRLGWQLIIVPAHLPRWLCRACGDQDAKRMGAQDAMRCDVCRRASAPLERFMVHHRTLLLVGKHCERCRDVVGGGR